MSRKEIDVIDVALKVKEIYEQEENERDKMKLLDAYIILLRKANDILRKQIEQSKELV